MRKLWFLSVLIFCFFTTLLIPSNVFEGKIYPANNREYQKLLLPRLKEAKNSIYIIMFLASYYPEYPDSPTNIFLKELIEAKKRGVNIEVVLNQSDKDSSSHSTVENLKTARYLSNNGIGVYFTNPNRTTHSKILVIDRRYVVIGSANWSYSAMEKNNETSVIIDSPKLAEFYIKYFEEIKKECLLFLQPASE
ncbi:MAG: phospholipase D-like domain-containing protein [Candidatus Omnitrophica bacterium]|nr:phospholipase D-like domain-containing protein [Candidatus Omnitrophota bacterium]MCM8777107.1 phospholipase D-like domain-containing protein [Candidatus Omnitrophota bacterium]